MSPSWLVFPRPFMRFVIWPQHMRVVNVPVFCPLFLFLSYFDVGRCSVFIPALRALFESRRRTARTRYGCHLRYSADTRDLCNPRGRKVESCCRAIDTHPLSSGQASGFPRYWGSGQVAWEYMASLIPSMLLLCLPLSCATTLELQMVPAR